MSGTTRPSHRRDDSAAISHFWNNVQHGLALPRLGLFIPWFCTYEEFLRLIPADEMWLSEGGRWPTLRERILGISVDWGFNFVSFPGRLVEAQFLNHRQCSARRTYRRSCPKLQRVLGVPNRVNRARLGQQTWVNGIVRIENHIAPVGRPMWETAAPAHFLSIRSDQRGIDSGHPAM